MGKGLPSLTGLRAFHAAGAHLSFKRAAAELHVTPSAISHQIRLLEAHLGVPLFIRINRSLKLTPAGEAYWLIVHRAFDELELGTENLLEAHAGSALRVSAGPLFSSVYLIPRLLDFQSLHPDLTVHVAAPPVQAESGRVTNDVDVRLGDGRWPGLDVHRLLVIRHIPVCAPQLLRDGQPPTTPEELVQYPFIHYGRQPNAWSQWLSAAGGEGLKPQRELYFDSMPAVLEAASAGLGVALGIDPLVREQPFKAKLVTLMTPRALDNSGYFLTCRPEDRDKRHVAAFRSWLSTQLDQGSPATATHTQIPMT